MFGGSECAAGGFVMGVWCVCVKKIITAVLRTIKLCHEILLEYLKFMSLIKALVFLTTAISRYLNRGINCFHQVTLYCTSTHIKMSALPHCQVGDKQERSDNRDCVIVEFIAMSTYTC